MKGLYVLMIVVLKVKWEIFTVVADIRFCKISSISTDCGNNLGGPVIMKHRV